jgi:hypothetical protein
VLLTAVGSAQAPGKLSNFMWLVGLLLCVGCGFRLLYGSVYLRPANIQPIPLSVIGAWGLLMAISWAVAVRAQPQHNSRLDWATKIIFVMMLGVAAAMLAMSGSLTYGVVGGLVALATVACLMTSGHLPPGSFVLAQCMIGLGHAFAELPLPAAVGTCLAVCACALCLQVASMRLRWAMLCLSILLMGVCGQLVTRQFLSSLQAKPESNGYEAYK